MEVGEEEDLLQYGWRGRSRRYVKNEDMVGKSRVTMGVWLRGEEEKKSAVYAA